MRWAMPAHDGRFHALRFALALADRAGASFFGGSGATVAMVARNCRTAAAPQSASDFMTACLASAGPFFERRLARS